MSPKHADDAPAAQQALKTAAFACPTARRVRPNCRPPWIRHLRPRNGAAGILAAVAERKALGGGRRGGQEARIRQLQDTSSRLLGEWMTIDAAPVLLDLAKTGSGEKYQARA